MVAMEGGVTAHGRNMTLPVVLLLIGAARRRLIVPKQNIIGLVAYPLKGVPKALLAEGHGRSLGPWAERKKRPKTNTNMYDVVVVLVVVGGVVLLT